jgi:peptidoglycan/LPS O-acetylase OafA/YrhL
VAGGTATPGRGRRPELDGLRGLAVLMVLVSHLSSYHAEQAGPVGVAIFFVLSGYLITSLLLAERDRSASSGSGGSSGSVDLAAFYTRRALRLLPALMLIVALTPLVLYLASDPRLRQATGGLVRSALYVQDFASATGHFGVLAHTWSLAVEEQFYLVWPLALAGFAVIAATSTRRLATMVTVLAVISALWHVVDDVVFSNNWALYSPDASAVFLLAGCAIAAHRRSGRALRPPRWAVMVALTVVLAGPLVLSREELGSWRIQALLMFPVCLAGVLLVMGADRLAVFSIAPLRWFGTISYGLYLWNWLFISLTPHGQALGGTARLAGGIAAVGVAAASWYLLEQPILRFKGRFERVSSPLNQPAVIELPGSPVGGSPVGGSPVGGAPITAAPVTGAGLIGAPRARPR